MFSVVAMQCCFCIQDLKECYDVNLPNPIAAGMMAPPPEDNLPIKCVISVIHDRSILLLKRQ